MTKKDYIIVAGALNKIRKEIEQHNNSEHTLLRVVIQIAQDLCVQNMRFDCKKFLDAVYNK